ncbi:MAG: O-antigen polymerase [Terriglobales bacterium]
MIDAITSPWFAYALLVIVTTVSRLRCGSWFAPGAFVGLIWSFFIGVSLLVVEYPIPRAGLGVLVLLIITIQAGALIVHQLRPRPRASSQPAWSREFETLIVPCRRYGVICAAIALAGCIYFLFTSLEQFGLPFTWMGVLGVGARWTLLRYTDVLEPWSVRAAVTWLHPAALLGGVLYACSSRFLDRVIGASTLLPAIAYAVLTAARAAVLLGLTCWIGGYVATLCARNEGRLKLFSVKRFASVLLVGASMLGMFAAIGGVRDSKWAHAFVLDFQESKIFAYMFGSPAAFAHWWALDSGASTAHWGERTFAGEFDLLHIKTRTIATYTDMTNVVSGAEETNVYTIFRGLIEDFTPLGTVLICACLGGLASSVYLTSSRHVRGALFWLSAFYSAALFSPLFSLFSFNGVMLAWVVAGSVFFLGKARPSFLPMAPSPAQGVWVP